MKRSEQVQVIIMTITLTVIATQQVPEQEKYPFPPWFPHSLVYVQFVYRLIACPRDCMRKISKMFLSK